MQSKGLFIFSLLISVYSIALFALGIFQVLTREYVLSLTLLFIGCLFITIKKSFNLFSLVYLLKKRKYIWFFVPLVLINLVGALGPELGFDALWYHLTIPKLYIERGQIDFIPGGLLYYSAMPKLIDLLYIPILIFSNEVGVKLLSLLFGFLTAVVTYKIARLFLNERLSILAALIFYSNLVVMWLSITAYIDLGRAFYASLAVYTLLLYLKDKKRIYFFLCAVLIGFEISTKLLGVGTLIVVSIVIFSISKETLLKRISEVLKFISISLAVVSPWLVFSFINTGSLIYPFFSNVYPSTTEFGLSPFSLFSDLTMLFLFSPDPISPLYILSFPLIIVCFKRFSYSLRTLVFVCLLVLIIWVFTPQKNARFIVPYLPLFSVVTVLAYSYTKNSLIKKTFIFFTAIIILMSFLYRLAANAKYVPYLLGSESKESFLSKNLNFNSGDYIDANNRVREIVGEEQVIIYGIHNLYYVDFNFDHESWADDNNYKYILSRGEKKLGKEYKKIYYDPLTNTYLYEKI